MAEYNESQINSNETERIAAEQQRIENEAQRQTKETEREAREATRQSNESTRISKEAERLAEEVNRQEAETSRVNAEQGRQEAENTRAEFYEGFSDRLDSVDSQLAHIENNVLNLGLKNDGVTDNAILLNTILSQDKKTSIYKFPKGIYKFVIDSEDKVIKLKSNTKLIFEKGCIIKFGIEQSPYFPLFWLDSVKNVEIDGLEVCYTGDFEPINGEETVTKLGVTTKERAFATIIGVKNATNCIIKNASCYGETVSNVYDAFIRGFGSHFENSIIDNVTLSHYNNGFSDGLTDCTIQNIKGLIRSNKSNNKDSNAYYGPSHLFYGGFNNSFISNIYEVGISLSDGTPGGATCQFTASKNLIVKNIYTKMKNTPSIFVKHTPNYSVENIVINDVICDCVDWDDNAKVECCVGTITNFNGVNCTFNNINVLTHDKNIPGVLFSGQKSFYKDIKIVASSSGSETFPLASLITLHNSFVDINIINNDNSRPCLFMSGCRSNNVKYNYKGEGIDSFGVHPYSGNNWGGSNNNDITIDTLSNNNFREFTGLTIYELQNNYFSKSKVYSFQHNYETKDSGEISTSVDLPRNGSYLVNISAMSGDNNHIKNETHIVLLDKGTYSFSESIPIATASKGSGGDYEITVTPSLRENAVPNIKVTATTRRNNVSKISMSVMLLNKFYS